MIYILGELCTGISSLLTKKNKVIGFLGFLVLAFLMGSADPRTTTDYPAYEYYYNYGGLTGNFYFEKGYSLISYFFYKCGFNYQTFRIIISFLGFLILFLGVKRFTNNIAFFSFVYGITLFFNDATQVRNFLMISLVIFALSFLVKNPQKKDYLICCLIIILSGEIHSLGFLFIIVPFLNMIDINKLKKYYNLIIIITATIIIFSLMLRRQIVRIILWLVSYINTRQGLSYRILTKYSNNQLGSRNILIICGIVMVSVAILYIAFYLLNNCYVTDLLMKSKIISCVLLLSLTTTPLLTVAIDYSRISRNTFLFFIILISMYFENKKSYRCINIIVTGSFLITSVLMTYLNTIIWGPLYIQSIPYLMKVLN